MAAAEYYNPGGPSQRPPAPAGPSFPQQQQYPPPPQNLQPPPQQYPPQQNGGGNLPYPMSDAPPPYTAYSNPQRPHSQPPPGQRMNQNGGYQPYNPNQPPNVNTHQYPPEKLPQQPQRPSTLQNMQRPSDYTSSHPPQQNGYPMVVGPGLSQAYNNPPRPPRRSSTTGYPNANGQPPSRSRSRSRSNSRRRHHHNPKPDTRQKKKSSGVDTFLGAGSGAIVGDLIFPGLGTLGGAILGGVGGHEYGKKRAQSNPSKNRRAVSNTRDYYDDEYDYRRGRKY